jgi:FhuF-like iron-sulfur protein
VPPPPWRPFTELLDQPDRLDARIHAVRTALAANAGRPPSDIDPRVAASVAHLGLVARLLAPTIAAAALGHGPLTDPWWQDHLGGPFPLSAANPAPDQALDPAFGPVADPPADQVAGRILFSGSTMDLLTTAAVTRFPIAPRVLWGNVASATNSAAQLVAATRPDLAAAARDAANAILADPRVEEGRLRAGPSFRRRSCCLIYRLSGTRRAVCGDCVLARGS